MTEKLIISSKKYKGLVETMRLYIADKEIEIISKYYLRANTVNIYKQHHKKIDSIILRKEKMLFIGHSQGNLFMNQAYNYAVKKTKKNNIGVIHVAPASIILNGKWILADHDYIINGLRVTYGGEVPPITDNIGLYFNRPAGINGATDSLGHGYLEIYLNNKLTTSNKFYNYVEEILTKFNGNCINKNENILQSKFKPLDFSATCDVRGCATNINSLFSGKNEKLDDEIWAMLQKVSDICKSKNTRRTLSGIWNNKNSTYDMSCQTLFGEYKYSESVKIKITK